MDIQHYFDRKVLLRLLLIGYLLFFCYFAIEYYLFTKESWGVVKWHTRLSILGFILLLTFTVAVWKGKFSEVIMLVMSLNLALIVAEIFFSFSALDLYSQFSYDPNLYYATWSPNQEHRLKSDEFDYVRMTNSYGFADKEWDTITQRHKRVLCLGDSYTEGDGAPFDSAYPYLLSTRLNAQADSFRFDVLNAGVCGSDPVFGYINLHDRLTFPVDVVVQTITTNDMLTDIGFKGGFERFLANGEVQFRPLPFWFYLSVFSSTCRLFYSIQGIDECSPMALTDEYSKELEQIQDQLVTKFDSLASARHFKVVFVLFPLREECIKGKYKYDFAYFQNRLKTSENVSFVNLMPCYQEYAVKHKIDCSKLYWDENGHHNSFGYNAMAECIMSAL